MDGLFFAELRLLEDVVEAFALGDSQCVANAFVIRTEPHQASHDGLVGAMSLAGASEGAVQLDARSLRRSTHETTRKQSEPACSCCVRRGWADHDGTDDIEQ